MKHGWSSLLALCLLTGVTAQAAAEVAEAAELRAKYQLLEAQLQHDPSSHAAVLESSEGGYHVRGDTYLLLDYPFAILSKILDSAGEWCEVMILHQNNKYCSARSAGPDSIMVTYIASKPKEGMAAAQRTQFLYHLRARTADYLEVAMSAAEGPLGTSDHRILAQALAVPGNKTFFHLSYAYRYSLSGKLAMKVYFATLGAGKVGFTRVGPDFIGGMRGLVERNTMRYSLAVEAYLSGLEGNPATRLERRLQHWFGAIEQYPRQLHELDYATYMTLKRQEYARQQLPD